MNAQEARQIAFSTIVPEDITEINELIEKAAKRGYLRICERITPLMVSYLKDNGFGVKFECTTVGESMYNITWNGIDDKIFKIEKTRSATKDVNGGDMWDC